MIAEPRIALCVIAGDDAIEQGIERMLRSVKGKVDGVFLSFNGNPEFFPSAVIKAYSDVVDEIGVVSLWEGQEWTDDFSTARNHSFSLVPADEYDWITWLDCDDVVPEQTDFREVAKLAAERHAHGVFMDYHYNVDQQTGVVVQSHLKDRLFRADVDWYWHFPIHESCHGPIATRMTTVRDHPIKHLRGEPGAKRERNRRITSRWYRENPGDMQAVLRMGYETYAAAMEEKDEKERVKQFSAAVHLFRRYLDEQPPGTADDDDGYLANLQVAQCYVGLARPNDAINLALQGIKMFPTWPMAYCLIAETYLRAEWYQKAVDWARTTREVCEPPDSLFTPFDHIDLDYRPMMIEGAALIGLKRYSEAVVVYTRALDLRDDEMTQNNLFHAIELEQEQEAQAVEQTPLQLMLSHWGRKPEQSICFFTAAHFEDWDDEVLKTTGLSGTETCVVQLAGELAERGWRVAIFGRPTYCGLHEDGVEYYQSGDWHPDQPFTATVSVRVPDIFAAKINSPAQLLWMHDVNVGPQVFPESIQAIICPSPFHGRRIIDVYGLTKRLEEGLPVPKIEVVSNGFDREMFMPDPDVQRDMSKMIYASSPDRGLTRLLDLWPDIRQAIPDASLHVFYGWDAIDKIVAMGVPHAPQLIEFKRRTEARLDFLGREDAGIHWVGRMHQAELAAHMTGRDGQVAAGFMPYPAMFEETFGLVFAQAMTAGVLPVTSATGNLTDMIGDWMLVIGGADADSEVFGEMFVDQLRKLHDGSMSPGDPAIMRARTESLTWSRVADVWETVIRRYATQDLDLDPYETVRGGVTG